MQPNNQQYTNFWYFATEQEARNWFVGPGVTMIFVDPNGQAIYKKSLSYDAYARPVFEVYDRRQPSETVQNQEPQTRQANNTEFDDLKAELTELKSLVNELRNSKPYYNNKKEGGK